MKSAKSSQVLIFLASLAMLFWLVPHSLISLNSEKQFVVAEKEALPRGFFEYGFSRKVNGENIQYKISCKKDLDVSNLPVYCSKLAPTICQIEKDRSEAIVIVGICFVLLANLISIGLPIVLRPWQRKKQD